MSEETYEQQILKAVDILTEGAIKDLKFDKTILATVESIVDITTGEHKVRFQDGSFSAFTSPANLYYSPGSLVYVQIPQGDFSEKKIITGGKTQLAGDQLSDHLNDFIENTYAEDAFKWIQSWWQTTDPSLGWTDGKAIHEGDFWYNTSNNNYSRYTKTSENVYAWVPVRGINAVSGLLSNENASVIGNANGSVSDLSPATGIFYVYEGNDLVQNAVFSIVVNSEVNCNATIDAITGEYSLTNFSSTELAASVTFKATLNGIEITKVFTIVKIVEGLSAKAVKLESSSYAIPYAADGSAPSLTFLSLTIIESNLEAPIYYEFFIDGESVQGPSTLSTYSYSSPTSWFNTPKTLRVEAREGLSTNPVVTTDSISIVAIKPGLDGSDGANGLPGAPGKDGLTPYFHTAWATSADGETGFSTTISTDKTYLGTYTDHTEEDSNTPSDYNWSLIKGADGVDGQDGVSAYLWIRYSINSDGSEMTTIPTNALYIGTATTTINTAPTDHSSYSWTLIKGDQGVAGEIGPDGQTSYLHIKYSNDGSTFTGNSGEDVGIYIGTYVDFTQADSSTFTDYTWNKVVGDEGPPAVVGILTNENHTFTANSAGVVSNYAEGVSEIRVYYGATLLTAQNTGTADPSEDNKYTVTSINNTSGTITLTPSLAGNQYKITPSAMTTDTAVRTLTIKARIDGVIHTLTKVLTYSKAKAGTDAETYQIELDPPNIKRSKDGILTPSFLTIKSYKTTGNATREPYEGRFKIYENGNSTAIYSSEANEDSYIYTPSATANHIKAELWVAEGFVTLLDTQSTVVTNDATGGNLLYTDEWIVDPDTEVTSSSFEHWSPIVNRDGDGLLNNVIINTNGPYETSTPVWSMTVQHVDNWVSASSTDFLIDNTQKYRFTLWFKKVGTDLDDGSIYIGTKANGVLSLTDTTGALVSWSYFSETDSSALNEWHLLVAHIHPYTNETVFLDSASGIYNIKGEKTNLEVTDFKWPADQLNSSFRFGYGYNTIQQEVYFYAPRVDLCDGNELPLHAFFPVLNLIENANAYFKTSFQLLNDDGVISAIEKRTLYEFWNTLMMDVSLLLSKANSTQFENINSDDFNSAYSSLKNYILGTENPYLPGLHLFQDFTSDTSLCLYVFRSGEYQEVLEALEDDTEIISAPDYWDLKWNTFYNEKNELELAIRAEELSQYNSQTSLLDSLTEFQVNADGTLTSINNVLEFTTEGLVVRVDGLSLKIIISNEKISFMNESGAEVAYITKDEMSIASLKAVNKLQLGIHTIEKLTPASHPTQTVIR